jgi:NADH-quinone oxidoreductase subunit C/D
MRNLNMAASLIESKLIFGDDVISEQMSSDNIQTIWVKKNRLIPVITKLKNDSTMPFDVLYDLSAIDERARTTVIDQPLCKFSVVYHLLSIERSQFLRLKVPLVEEYDHLSSIVSIFTNANWYEREVYDMFGIRFDGHPHLRRILMPQSWQGHPLRKEHPARATEMGPYVLPDDKQDKEQGLLQFDPEEWGLKSHENDQELMFLNLGPQHPGTHGVLRVILQMYGENIREAVLDIGFHHRGAEKMAERQTWHGYIPYTDRIDYLGGVMNNLPYLLALEQLAAIDVPPRAQVIRVMLCEFFRIASHLVWYGTFAQDVGSLSPVFYMFNDRERILSIIEGITGGRMHPSWFRMGGVAHDLPQNWLAPVLDFVSYMPKRLKEYDDLVMKNSIFRARTKGIGSYNKKEALEWGVSGPGLRATGVAWDLRKARPYSGYENFDFEIPIAHKGDCYDRAIVRIEEIKESLKIIEQCAKNMPAGDYKSDHPLAMPPRKDKTLIHIETLINHFVNTTWGSVIPQGESFFAVEASKGTNAYFLVSDNSTHSYRTRIRTPSFPHLQMTPLLARGRTISDLMAILGSIDFVLADLDR